MSESTTPPTNPITSQVSPVENDASFVVPQQSAGANKSRDLGHSRVFNYGKWLLILALSVVATGAIIAIVVAIQASIPKTGSNLPSATPTPPDIEVKTTHDEGDDNYFAELPLTMLYYSYSQTTNTKNVFQANPDDSQSRFVNVGFPDRYSFATSPNGKSLIRWSEEAIDIASAAKPATFQPLFKPQGSQITIRRATWSTDSSRVAISYTKAPVDTKKFANVVVIVEVPTGNSAVLLEDETDFVYDLLALVDNTRLFYRQDRNGLYSNLTEYDVVDKKVSRDLAGFNSGGLLSKLTFNQKMDWGYTFQDNQVLRYNMTTFDKQVVWSIDRTCKNSKQPNNSSVTSLSVSPNSDLVLFTVVPEACRNGSANKGVDLRPKLYTYNIKDQKIVKEQADPIFTKLQSSSWAPNNAMVWLQLDTQRAYGINPQTLAMWPIPPTERNTLTKERPLLLGWLIAKN